MAVVVFMRFSKQSGQTGFKNGDSVSIVNDGQTVGNQVDPVLNISSIFQIVDVPGASINEVRYSLDPVFGPEVGPPGFENRPLVGKRENSMRVTLLPLDKRASWNQGLRIALTLAEFTAAVIPKAGP